MGNLSRNQRRVLRAFAVETSVTDVAAMAGLSRRTVYSYLKDPDFIEALEQQQEEMRRASMQTTLALDEQAKEVMTDLLEDAAIDPAVRAKIAIFLVKEVNKIILRGEEMETFEETGEAILDTWQEKLDKAYGGKDE